MRSPIRSNYLAKEIAKNIKHFVHQGRGFQSIYQKQMAITARTREKFLEKVCAGSYLNPLIDMCFELGILFKPVDVRSVLFCPGHLGDTNIRKRGNTLYYTYGYRKILNRARVKFYYTDLINHLFINGELWEIMELNKNTIQYELLKSGVAIENWETKPKPPRGS